MTLEQLNIIQDTIGYPGNARPLQVCPGCCSLEVASCRSLLIIPAYRLTLTLSLTPTLTAPRLQDLNSRTVTYYSKPKANPPFRFTCREHTLPSAHDTSHCLVARIVAELTRAILSCRCSIPLPARGGGAYAAQPPYWAAAQHCSDAENHGLVILGRGLK